MRKTNQIAKDKLKVALLRSKYRRLDSPLHERGEYSFEVLATVASSLLVGDDYDQAIERATALLEACRARVNERWIERITPTLLKENRHVPFKDAVKDITGYSDNEYAREKFFEFFAAILLLLYDEPVKRRQFEALAQRHVDKGFAPETVLLLNSLFSRYWPEIQRRLAKLARKKKSKKRLRRP